MQTTDSKLDEIISQTKTSNSMLAAVIIMLFLIGILVYLGIHKS